MHSEVPDPHRDDAALPCAPPVQSASSFEESHSSRSSEPLVVSEAPPKSNESFHSLHFEGTPRPSPSHSPSNLSHEDLMQLLSPHATEAAVTPRDPDEGPTEPLQLSDSQQPGPPESAVSNSFSKVNPGAAAPFADPEKAATVDEILRSLSQRLRRCQDFIGEFHTAKQRVLDLLEKLQAKYRHFPSQSQWLTQLEALLKPELPIATQIHQVCRLAKQTITPTMVALQTELSATMQQLEAVTPEMSPLALVNLQAKTEYVNLYADDIRLIVAQLHQVHQLEKFANPDSFQEVLQCAGRLQTLQRNYVAMQRQLNAIQSEYEEAILNYHRIMDDFTRVCADRMPC